jgi:putative membrane protein
VRNSDSGSKRSMRSSLGARYRYKIDHSETRREEGELEKMSDPRVFFAAERTLLAWVRSGLTITALGFVVARFGLFLNLMAASTGISAAAPHWSSEALGIILVLAGSAVIPGAFHNYRLYVRSLPPEDLPKLAILWLTSFLSVSIAVVGILLAMYLLFA